MKRIFDVMLHLEAEWPSKQNILIADIVLAEPGQVLRFVGQDTFLGGKIFVFIICLNQFFQAQKL